MSTFKDNYPVRLGTYATLKWRNSLFAAQFKDAHSFALHLLLRANVNLCAYSNMSHSNVYHGVWIREVDCCMLHATNYTQRIK